MVTTNGQSHTTTEYEGIAQRVNEHGILFAGRTSWANISKFAGAVELPPPGARVRCTLDKSGYVRSCEVIGDAPALSSDSEESHHGEPGRETQIRRMAAINSAIALLTNTGPASVEQVLDVTSQFEQWVTR